jgi:hypothetical protein
MENHDTCPKPIKATITVCATKDEITFYYTYFSRPGEALDYIRENVSMYSRVWIEFEANESGRVLILPFCQKCNQIHHSKSYSRKKTTL